MQCTSCKAELAPGTRTCPVCGAATPYAAQLSADANDLDQTPYAEQVSYIDKGASEPTIADRAGEVSRQSVERAGPEERPMSVSDEPTVRASSSGVPQPTGYSSAPQPTPEQGTPSAALPKGEQQPSSPPQAVYPGQPPYPLGAQRPQQPVYLPNPAAYPGQQFPQQQGYPMGYYQGQQGPPPQGYQTYQGQGFPQQPGYGPGMFPPPVAQQKQSHLARNIVLALVGVLIVGIIIGVIGLTVLARLGAPASVTAHATPTLGSITTNDPQELYNAVTSRTPTVDDSLSKQGQTSWLPLNAGSQGTCQITNGALHAKAPQGTSVGCLDSSDTYNNFALQVQMTMIQGDAAGLTFRTDPVGGKSYELIVAPQGAYILLSISAADQNPKAITGGNSQAINTGYNQSNQVMIVARNNNIYLYINKQYIFTVTDTTSSSGMIGMLGTGKVKNSAVDVAYSNLKIWKL